MYLLRLALLRLRLLLSIHLVKFALRKPVSGGAQPLLELYIVPHAPVFLLLHRLGLHVDQNWNWLAGGYYSNLRYRLA